MSLLPTGGLSSARCSSIQRCKFSGCRFCMRLYYVDETQQLINPSKLAYGTQTRAAPATVRAPSSAWPFKDTAVITDTSNPLRRVGGRWALIAVAAGLG